MNLTNFYYYFKSVIPERICNDIVKYGNQMKSKKTGIEKDNSGSKFNLKKRNSNIKFFSDQAIYDQIIYYVRKANESANWNYDFDWVEEAQYTIYKKNQHYDWHCDQSSEPYKSDDINFNGKTRKLSCTLLLNDTSKYEGGDFEFDFRNNKKGNNIKKATELTNQGDLIIFPSYVWHRVTPVTKGTRKSLVMWTIGSPFK